MIHTLNHLILVATTMPKHLHGAQVTRQILQQLEHIYGVGWRSLQAENACLAVILVGAILRAINQTANLLWACLPYRRTLGSQPATKGESLYKIATLMGNSPEICRSHYAALLPES